MCFAICVLWVFIKHFRVSDSLNQSCITRFVLHTFLANMNQVSVTL